MLVLVVKVEVLVVVLVVKVEGKLEPVENDVHAYVILSTCCSVCEPGANSVKAKGLGCKGCTSCEDA